MCVCVCVCVCVWVFLYLFIHQRTQAISMSLLLLIKSQWIWECRYLFKILIFISSGHIPSSGIARLYGACSVTQLCPTLLNPMDCSPPGSSIHEISQAIILEWVSSSASRGFPPPGMKPTSPASPAWAGGFFTTEAPGKVNHMVVLCKRRSPQLLSTLTCSVSWGLCLTSDYI